MKKYFKMIVLMGIVWTLGVGLNACKEGDEGNSPLRGTAGGDVVGEWKYMGSDVVELAHQDATLEAKFTAAIKNSMNPDLYTYDECYTFLADHTWGWFDKAGRFMTSGSWNDNGNIFCLEWDSSTATDIIPNNPTGIFYIENDILMIIYNIIDEKFPEQILEFCDEETINYVFKFNKNTINDFDTDLTFRDLKFNKIKFAEKYSRVQSN